MSQPVKFYFDLISQPCRALYIFLEASKIPFEAVPISLLKGEHLTGEYRDKVSRFKKVPAINDHGFQLSESVAIFRHLCREKIVPEHWYPRRNLSRSRIDEYLEWQHNNMRTSCTDYFRTKWLLPYLHKARPSDEDVFAATKRLDLTLNEFENLFLHSKDFMVGSNISFADLMAICEIDQPKALGYNPFQNRTKLQKWYRNVQEALGPYHKAVVDDLGNRLRSEDKSTHEAMSLKQ